MQREPIPSTIEGCCDEVARAGFLLKRSISDTIVYELIDVSAEPPPASADLFSPVVE